MDTSVFGDSVSTLDLFKLTSKSVISFFGAGKVRFSFSVTISGELLIFGSGKLKFNLFLRFLSTELGINFVRSCEGVDVFSRDNNIRFVGSSMPKISQKVVVCGFVCPGG